MTGSAGRSAPRPDRAGWGPAPLWRASPGAWLSMARSFGSRRPADRRPLVPGPGARVHAHLVADPRRDLVRRDHGTGGFVLEGEGLVRLTGDGVSGDLDPLHVVDLQRLPRAYLTEVVGERDVGAAPLAAAVSGAAVRALGDQALVVDPLALVAVDEHVLAGRTPRVGGVALHAVRVRPGAVRADVGDRVVQDLQVAAEEPQSVVVAAGRVLHRVVPHGDVVAGQLDAGGLRVDRAEPGHHHVVGLHGDALDRGGAVADDHDRRVRRARPVHLEPGPAHVADRADLLAGGGGADGLLQAAPVADPLGAVGQRQDGVTRPGTGAFRRLCRRVSLRLGPRLRVVRRGGGRRGGRRWRRGGGEL